MKYPDETPEAVRALAWLARWDADEDRKHEAERVEREARATERLPAQWEAKGPR